MSKILFVTVRSPSEKDPMELIHTLAGGDEVGLLLFEDGVLIAQVEAWRKKMNAAGVKLYAAADDLRARGGVQEGEGFETVEYPRIATLIMEEHDKVVNI